jgi:hypothetical protein
MDPAAEEPELSLEPPALEEVSLAAPQAATPRTRDIAARDMPPRFIVELFTKGPL